MKSGAQIVTQARAYAGVRFRHAGRSKEFGVDCLGLIICTLRDLGWLTHDETNYSKAIDPMRLRRALARYCEEQERKSIADLQEGDFLVFNIQRVPQHTAIATGDGKMIHSWESVGKVAEHAIDRWWWEHYHACFRWRELCTRGPEGLPL